MRPLGQRRIGYGGDDGKFGRHREKTMTAEDWKDIANGRDDDEPQACADPSMIMTDEECIDLVCADPVAARNTIYGLKGVIDILHERIAELEAAIRDVCDDELDHEACVDHAKMILGCRP